MKDYVETESTFGTIEALAVPGTFNAKAHRSALELDDMIGRTDVTDEAFGQAVMTHGGHHHDHLVSAVELTPVSLAWPSGWYIPGDADYRRHWIMPPPGTQRYAYDWKNQPHNQASRAAGTMSAFGQIRPADKHVLSEAGLGVSYTPPFSYGVVSLRPDVTCTGETRWWQTLDESYFVFGSTHTTTSLVLAQWHQIPNGWDLIHFRRVLVEDGFVQSGSGGSAIKPYQRSFTGDNLATKFVVQKGHTYLFGVVARVEIWSSLGDDRGIPLPTTYDGAKFKIWGSIACTVPFIEVREDIVYIK